MSAQGQTIGFVGMTGMATGPHLHYEFRVDGMHRDPLTVTLPKPEPLPRGRAGALPAAKPADAGQAEDAGSHANSSSPRKHAARQPPLYLGLISGTSADGIDVALASFDPRRNCMHDDGLRYPEILRRRILELAQGDGRIALDELGALDVEIARCFADAATQLACSRHRIAPSEVTAHRIARPNRAASSVCDNPPYTMQLGDPNVIAERTGILTVADFRRRDMAAGGQGAPLAPAFHAAMLATNRSAAGRAKSRRHCQHHHYCRRRCDAVERFRYWSGELFARCMGA